MTYTLNDVVGMELKDKREKPPNWSDIIAVFPQVEHKTGVLFCYGDTIYNPSGVVVPIWLIGHECVHSLQQTSTSMSAERWWNFYLAYPQFRLEHELAAHRVELEAYNVLHNRALRRSYAHAIAERLAGPLYGNMLKTRDALRLITEKKDDEVRSEDERVLVSERPTSGYPEGPAIRGDSGSSEE